MRVEGEEEEAADEEAVLGKHQQQQKKQPGEKRRAVVWEWEVLNSVAPIWTRSPRHVSDAEYIEFYKVLAHTYREPLRWAHFSVEGDATFTALLYIPHDLSLDAWEPVKAGAPRPPHVRLFVRHVFVTEQQVFELLPPWLRFMVGVVDSDDLPINVGRETVQETRMVEAIKAKLVSKTLAMVRQMFADDPNRTGAYARFHDRFASALKLGAAEDPANRDTLLDLLLFDSTYTDAAEKNNSKGVAADEQDEQDDEEVRPFGAERPVRARQRTTLREYVERAHALDAGKSEKKQRQQCVLYVAADTLEEARRSPLLERVVAEGREALLLSDAVDEHVMAAVRSYVPPDQRGSKRPERFRFVDLARNDDALAFLSAGAQDDDGEKAREQERGVQRVERLAEWMKEAVGLPQLERVVASTKLRTSPAAVTVNEHGLTSSMERLVRGQTLRLQEQQQLLEQVRRTPTRVLELNPQHPLVREMARRVNNGDTDARLRRAAKMLYHTALATSGYEDDEPADLAATAYSLLEDDLGVTQNEQHQEKQEKQENNKDEL